MVTTDIFPKLARLYKNHDITEIKESWRIGSGWSLNVYRILPLPAQIRYLKEEGYTQFRVELYNRKTNKFCDVICKSEDFSLVITRPKYHWNFAQFFRLSHSYNLINS